MSMMQKRLMVIAVLVLVAGWGIWQLFAVRKVVVNANGRQAEIESEARKIIDGNLWWGSLLTFDDGSFVAKLGAQDPLLRDVSVRRRWFHTVVVSATLKAPSLGWDTGNQGYVLDRDGTVIGPLTNQTGMPVVFDGSNLPVQVGQHAASQHFVEFTSQMVPALAGMGITVTRLDIKETTLDLTAQTNKGYRLLFDTSRTVGEELSDLRSVLALLASQKRAPAEYIDLRIAGKAYFK
jgi:cell division septal protein FtsQ